MNQPLLLTRIPTEDFDVGRDGISGYYDKMLRAAREVTDPALRCLFLWACVLTWPAHTVIFHLGPVLTAAWVIRIGLIIMSAPVAAGIAQALYFRMKWRALERQGLYFIWVNDHLQRIVFFRASDSYNQYDGSLQEDRQRAHVSARRGERDKIIEHLKEIGLFLGLWSLLPLALLIIPLLFPPDWNEAIATALRYAHTHLKVWRFAFWLGDYWPEGARWLMRDDVHQILASGSITFFVAILFAFHLSLRLAPLGWTLYDRHVRARGDQYIPGAVVLETYIREKTLDDLRAEQVYGGLPFADPDDAVKKMRKSDD